MRDTYHDRQIIGLKLNKYRYNFHLLVVGRGSETQLHVDNNLIQIT